MEKKISQLSEITSIDSSVFIPVVKDVSGITDNYKITPENAVKAYVGSKIVNTFENNEVDKAPSISASKIFTNETVSVQTERLKYQNIEEANRGIVKIKELYDVRPNVSTQSISYWSHPASWSWAVAKKDMLADEIGVHVYIVTQPTTDLEVKIFIDGILTYTLIKPNAELGNTTYNSNIEYITLPDRLSIKAGQEIVVGYETQGNEMLQLTYCSTPVDTDFEFGLNQLWRGTNGSVIAAAVPPTTPASGDWYFPFYFNSFKVYDTSNPNNNLTQLDKLEILKNGGNAYELSKRIKPIQQLWYELTAYESKSQEIWYKGVTNKQINCIAVPLVRNFPGNGYFTDGVTVKIYYDGVLLKSKVITLSELAYYNDLTISSPLDNFFYEVDVDLFTIEDNKILYLGLECNGASDLMGMVWGGPSNATDEWVDMYTRVSGVPGKVINLTYQPAPVSGEFYRAFNCYYKDYIGKQITDKIAGETTRTDLSLLVPKKIYNVFNNINGTAQDNLFNMRYHSSTLYFDQMVTNITSDLDIDFTETNSEKYNLYAPVMDTDVSTITKSITFNKDNNYNGGTISVIQKNVKETVGASKLPKILAIGDSVTSGYLASVGNKDGLPSQYWGVIKEQFEQSKIDSGNNSLHNCVMVGQNSSNHWNMTYGNVTDRPMKAFAEGFGGWSSTTHMFWSTNWQVRAQGLWDALGLGNGTGTDYTNSGPQNIAIHTTPEGYLTPKNTAAFIAFINSELNLSVTTYADAVTALTNRQNNPVNPFYDKTKASGGVIAFSLSTYLSRYKTLNNDGVTRLIVGSTAGTKVTDASATDVCLPSHIILAHSHNDDQVSWFADNIRLWTDSIKAEYTANSWGNVFIGISVIRHTGTYYPKRYPMFDKNSIALWNSQPNIGYANTNAIFNKFWVSDANEDTEKIYILPSMFVQPPAWGTPFRRVNTPEYDITGISQHMYMTINGLGPTYHPNALAHRCWGIQMYAWIRYTLNIM